MAQTAALGRDLPPGPAWQAWLGPLRLPFLLLPFCCVLLAAALVRWLDGALDGGRLLLVLAGAVSAHIAVNAFNEWFDFRNGLDALTQRTPFSGGSGTLPRYPQLASYTLGVALLALALSAAIGVLLLRRSGWTLLPLGLAGLALVASYSPWLVRRPWLCLVAPGLGFGPLMVVGSSIALGGHHSAATWLASLLPFFLANNLLLLNQFPDVEADRAVGRRNLPILYGRPLAARVYALQLAGAYLVPVTGVLSAVLPLGALLSLATLPLALLAARTVWRQPDEVKALLPAMAMNVAINLLTPLLLALGLRIA